MGVSERGLYGIGFEELFASRRREVPSSSVRLSRQGESVAFHLEPDNGRFDPGSKLYFLSDGEVLNPYGAEAVYEISLEGDGEAMEVDSAAASGPAVEPYWRRVAREENRIFASNYEPANLWVWDTVFASTQKSFRFEVSELADGVELGELELWLQGVSLEEGTVFGVRLTINDEYAGEVSWSSDEMEHLTVEYSPELLCRGENTLTIKNITENDYSTMILDRFALSYPRWAIAEEGKLEGSVRDSGTLEVMGLEGASRLLDITDERPRWLEVPLESSFRFRAESGRRYLAVSEEAVLSPRVVRAAPSVLRNTDNQADYLVVGPGELLAAAAPLLELRQSQGLSSQAVALEEVYADFGFGEESPGALGEFLSFAYHHWSQPGPQYVVLLGDGTYDYKDYLGTGVENQVPPLLVKSTYMWTASDPTYGAVNGEDALPDLAIGRLPASTLDEARRMVEKIVSYETGGFRLMDSVALVADNPDKGGDFEANAEEIAAQLGLVPELTKIYLGLLGVESTRTAIAEAFDGGASLLSYIGHGGLDRWAHEKVLDVPAVGSLYPQPQQPVVLTLNCLNGYFHLPYYDALAEELLKAEGKGAIATFSPSGMSLNDPAHRLHKALIAELAGGGHTRLGDAILAAQSTYTESGAFLELLQLFHLLGDPALTLK
jgi:hypothetical protein